MSIETKLNRLSDTKEDIKRAIQSKGVSVANSEPFRTYGDKVRSIQTFSGGAVPKRGKQLLVNGLFGNGIVTYRRPLDTMLTPSSRRYCVLPGWWVHVSKGTAYVEENPVLSDKAKCLTVHIGANSQISLIQAVQKNGRSRDSLSNRPHVASLAYAPLENPEPRLLTLNVSSNSSELISTHGENIGIWVDSQDAEYWSIGVLMNNEDVPISYHIYGVKFEASRTGESTLLSGGEVETEPYQCSVERVAEVEKPLYWDWNNCVGIGYARHITSGEEKSVFSVIHVPFKVDVADNNSFELVQLDPDARMSIMPMSASVPQVDLYQLSAVRYSVNGHIEISGSRLDSMLAPFPMGACWWRISNPPNTAKDYPAFLIRMKQTN